ADAGAASHAAVPKARPPRCDLEDPMMRAAVMSSLAEGTTALLTVPAREQIECGCSNAAVGAFYQLLLETAGARGKAEESRRAVESVAELPRRANAERARTPAAPAAAIDTLSLARALAGSIQKRGTSLASVDPEHRLQPVFDLARRVAPDRQLSEEI